MNCHKAVVVLIGFQDQGNLGLGYLSTVLMDNGYEVYILDIKEGPDQILQFIRRSKPVVVGFSMIFQYYLPKFTNLASFLRSRGVDCHMTIGGHYPSLCYQQILANIPEIDSVVLFEGEFSLLELVRKLSTHEDWHKISGIAYQENGQVAVNSLRPLVKNLDHLPFPHRPFLAHDTLGKKMRPILATRGCSRNCVFCSIREFYGRAPGKLVRRRSPENVVQEMAELYHRENISIFLFQDDDFPLIGKAGKRWVKEFIGQLGQHGLIGKVIWKISCRVDEVEPSLFAEMQNAGLYLVYLGIESGTDVGLKTLNKQVTTSQILQAVTSLKELNILFSYGFMMFDPSSTFKTVLENTQFLRKIVGDGSAAVQFCKMLPYAGTPIKTQLELEVRLLGSTAQPDYKFLEARLDDYYEKLNIALNHWVYGNDAVAHNLNHAWHEVAVIKHLFNGITDINTYTAFLKQLTRKSNSRILDIVEQSVLEYDQDGMFSFNAKKLNKEARQTVDTMLEQRNLFIYRNQDPMLSQLNVQAA